MDELLDRVAADIGAAADAVGTRVVLVGALAVGRIAPLGRNTTDADFAILVRDWPHLDAFIDACGVWFSDRDRVDLKMVHRATGVRVDVVPCGAIEDPSGTLRIRGSDRVFNNTGIAECFDLCGSYGDLRTVLVAPASALVVLKLFA